MTAGGRALKVVLALVAGMTAAVATAPAEAGILATVKARGHVICGVGDGPRGFSSVDKRGTWSGIEVDFCSALAAAVFGDAKAVKFRLLAPSERFAAVQSGEVDVLARHVEISLSRDTSLGLRFVAPLVYDGHAFLARKSQSITSALELTGAKICLLSDVESEQAVADYFGGQKMRHEVARFENWQDAVKAYDGRGCTVLASDMTTLTLTRMGLAHPAEHMILPELISKLPLGPVIKQGDDEWFGIVRWTINALVAAEELGVTSSNADAMRNAANAEARRLLGRDGDLGKRMGLNADWAFQIVRQVGNYGEVFDRNLGAKSPLKMERRLNNLWTKNGLQYALPFR
ncbi:MAG: amino acid ABC transporter substrate-binding protein [Hyphomicrobiaceae bacterium]